jgi:hypothetical protein
MESASIIDLNIYFGPKIAILTKIGNNFIQIRSNIKA